MNKLIIILFFTFIFSEYEKLPNHFLKDFNNKKRNVTEFIESGPVAINFWFLACEPCKKEMLYLSDFNLKYSKEKKQLLFFGRLKSSHPWGETPNWDTLPD